MTTIFTDEIISQAGKYILKPLEQDFNTDEIKRFIISKMPIENGGQIIKDIETYIDNLVKKKKLEEEISYYDWTHSGWFKIQRGALQKIFKSGGIGICYCCSKKFNDMKSVSSCKYNYIISDKLIPKMIVSNFTRLFLICEDCEKKVKPMPPPKAWQESIIMSILNESNHQIKTILDLTMKDNIIDKLNLKFEELCVKEKEVSDKIFEKESNLNRLDKIIMNFESSKKQKADMLHQMIKNNGEKVKLLEEEEEKLREQIYEIESRIIKQRSRMKDELENLRNTINDEFKVIERDYSNSGIAKLNAALKSVDDDMCQICCDNQINMVLQPCNHMIICDECSNSLDNTCPLCRTVVTNRLKIFRN